MTTHRLPGPPDIPVHITKDRTLRVKIIDSCGLACTFCHNEGTPVSIDNRSPGRFTGNGASGRVSIYLNTNGADFLATAVPADDVFAEALRTLTNALDLDEVHFTGGEPSLHPHLPQLVAIAASQGLRVCMTSNGENAARTMPACGAAGLDRVNFSIFGTTAAELAQVQGDKFANMPRAERKIAALTESIAACIRNGVKASANIVVPGPDHAPRVHRLLQAHSPHLSIRLLNSLDEGQTSITAINQILADLGAEPIAHHITAGASGTRTAYRIPDGRVVYFKQIRPTRLPITCAGCRFNNDTDCQEGYYGVRLYRDQHGTYQVGVCIQRMDLCQPLDEFLASGLRAEIRAFRDNEYQHLTRIHQPSEPANAH